MYVSVFVQVCFFINFPSFKPDTENNACLACLLDAASKFELFSVSGLKEEKLIKKQTYMKTETCKLYSRVF